jgi:hypothetical protein
MLLYGTAPRWWTTLGIEERGRARSSVFLLGQGLVVAVDVVLLFFLFLKNLVDG